MSDYTKHLRLIKPSGNEYYDIENFNHNAELIDKETEDLSNKVAEIQQGATREKAGIVQFGTEEGKALEGMMLARLAGCVGYGGDIQTAGVKDVNYIYYDRNTRKMYKCLNQNSDVSANVANFIPLDNNSLLERLENVLSFYAIYEWGSKITGNLNLDKISLNNTDYKVKVQKNGFYLIVFTARVSAVDKVSASINILKNNSNIASMLLNPTFFHNKYEETATISTVTYITTEDIIHFNRTHALDNNTQANIVLLRLKA
ncbi:hypothetical protein LDK17_02760 [Fusobacterium polymorphum]|uniref:hypothetical protein n=1 Tax=Fusobacterium nucleatum subsp. polymorphum TaxID=76857 RepID=UPI0030D21865